MRQKTLVDAVDLGVKASEILHPAFGNFARGNPNPLNIYQGDSRLMDFKDLSHFREAPEMNAVHLRVPEEFTGQDLELEIALRCYRYGSPEKPPEPTLLHAMSKTRWARLGEVTIPDDGKFHVYRFSVPGKLAVKDGFMVRLDDTANFFSHEHHYGKSIGYMRLEASPLNGVAKKIPAEMETTLPPDICLVMCPVWDILMPPVALGTLASVLEGNGVNVAVYDFNIDCYHMSPTEDHVLWEGANAVQWSDWEYAESMIGKFEPFIQKAADRILSYNAPHVGFSLASVNAAFTMRLAEIIKERSPETIILYGGPGVPFFPIEQLGTDWDYLVYGAGEYPLLSLLKDGNPKTLGLISREDPQPYEPGSNRAFLTELDPLPLIHYEHFDLTRYLHPWRIPVMTSRGCINSCKYCFDTVFYGPFSRLSGKRAFEQLKFLHDKHDRKVIEFSDLLCNGDLDELQIMCELLAEAGMELQWGSFAVMRPGMTPELMKKMKAAGCKYLHYGFETGSERMLQLMGRDYSVVDAHDSLKNTKEAGIQTKINIMVGFPGESDKTIQETIDFIAENGKYIDLVETVNPVYVMASTDLSMNQDKYGIEVPDGVPDHWEAGQVTEEKRREWVYTVMDAVRKAGVTCNYAIMRGFTCKSVDDDGPV